MIEDTDLDALTDLEVDRLERSLYQQLRRGLPEVRLEGALACLLACRERLGRNPPTQAFLRRARAMAAPARARYYPRLEEQSFEGLSLEELLVRRRALQVRPGAPVGVVEARKRIERLLGLHPREIGRLRAAVREVEEHLPELAAADLSPAERQSLTRRLQRIWAEGMRLQARLVAATAPSAEDRTAARAFALECYRRLTRASRSRIIEASRQLHEGIAYCLEELVHWRDLYLETEEPWLS